MKDEPEQKAVTVVICKESHFINADRWKHVKMVINMVAGSGSNVLCDDILRRCELDKERHVIRLHLQDGCDAAAIWNQHIWPDENIEQTGQRPRKIYACIEPRETSLPKPTDLSATALRAGEEIQEMRRRSKSCASSLQSGLSGSNARYGKISREELSKSIEEHDPVNSANDDHDNSQAQEDSRNFPTLAGTRNGPLDQTSSSDARADIFQSLHKFRFPPVNDVKATGDQAKEDESVDDGLADDLLDEIGIYRPSSSASKIRKASEPVHGFEKAEAEDGTEGQRRSNRVRKSSTKSTRKSSKATMPSKISGDEKAGDLPEDDLPTTKPSISNKKQTKGRGGKDIHYYRIGTQKATKESAANAIQPSTVVIAEFSVDATRNIDSKIGYTTADAWEFNGVEIGRVDEGPTFDITDVDNWKPDPYFKGINRVAIKQRLESIAKAEIDIRWHNTPKGCRKSSSNDRAIHLVDRPRIPTYAAREASPQGLKWSNKPIRGVDCVVYFKNEIHQSKLNLDSNLQVTLEADETYESFKKWVLDGDDLNEKDKIWKGLRSHPSMRSFDNGFQIEIWVLPQIEGSSEMFCWTRHKEMEVEQWLDEEVAQKYKTHSLYIEVLLLSNDPNHENKGDWVVDKGVAKVKKVDKRDEEEIQVAAKDNRGKGKKRSRADENELDGDKAEGEVVEQRMPANKKRRRSSKK